MLQAFRITLILFVLILQDPSLLEGRVTLRQVKAGSVVANQGDQVCNDNQPRSSNVDQKISAAQHLLGLYRNTSVLLRSL